MSFEILAAAQGAVLNPVPPPPVVRAVSPPPITITPTLPPAPPMPVIRSDYVGGAYDRPTAALHIRVIASGAELFNERLRVGRTGANYNLTRSESADRACDRIPFPNPERTTFALTVRPEGPTRDHYRVNVTWSRPIPGCDTPGNRSVSLDQSVVIKSGQVAVAEGDAGLRVEIRRP